MNFAIKHQIFTCMHITYDDIKPIVAGKYRIDKQQIRVEFMAENQSVALSAIAFVPLSNPDKQEGSNDKQQESLDDDETVRCAIVNAFRTLSIFYEYDERKKKWIFKPPY